MAKFVCTENTNVVVDTEDEQFINELRKHPQYQEVKEDAPVEVKVAKAAKGK